MVNAHVNTASVLDLLSTIPDPEIPVINIRDLGMLRNVEYRNDEYVVTITPTYTACPAMGMIEDQIKEKLHEFGIDNVKVNLTHSPAWSTDWISEEAKLKLKQYGISPPLHSSCSKIFPSPENIVCPRCNSLHTSLISRFGSTACKSLYKCNSCLEPFEYFKCH